MPTNSYFHTSLAAAVILLAKSSISWIDWPTTEKILEGTGASRSQAYHLRARLEHLLPSLLGSPGRPHTVAPDRDTVLEVSRCLQSYLMRNPGAAHLCGDRFYYTDGFRKFVLGLQGPGGLARELSLAELAEATQIPLGTLRGWLGRDALDTPEPPEVTLRQEHQHQIISLYRAWKGSFLAFCQMVRQQLRLNYGMTTIGRLLEQVGLRLRKRREKAPPWSRDSFVKLFPGAQWLGDGTSVKIQGIDFEWEGQSFSFNLEALLDVASNAVVGLKVSDSEDGAAVLDAFRDGVKTAGKAPLALSLDNRPSNHSPVVEEALSQSETTLLASTLGRGQSKAPLEGAFGLFKQDLPELIVAGGSPREQAKSVLELTFCAWARGRNGRPRKQLGGKSPADYYRSHSPTDQEIAAAKQWIAELQRRQDQMRRTREQRADQAKLAMLKDTLATLAIADPKNQLAIHLAYYCRDAIVSGISIFQTKRQLGTIPEAADPGRYLGGIIRRLHDQIELDLTNEFQIKNRARLRDLSLRKLLAEEDQLRRRNLSDAQMLYAVVDRALSAPYAIDYHFWTTQSVAILEKTRDPLELYKAATRRIASCHRADRNRRHQLSHRLSQVLSDF